MHHRLPLTFGTAFLILLFAWHSQAFPSSSVTFKDNSPFQGASGVHSLTSSDGLMTVAAWGDVNASVSANLYQWWWLLGVDSGTGNGALIDGQESMTLQFDKGVGASHITFLYTGGQGGSVNNLARITISGFLSDPGAYAIVASAPRISNLHYASGALSFDYLWDNGGDYGQLFFANPAASAGQTLKITGAASPNGDATSWEGALFSVASQESYAPAVQPSNVRYNSTNSYATADGALIVKGFLDRAATMPGNFGTYLDQCFGVYGGGNNGAIDTDETVTLQFAPGFGLSRLESVYSAGPVTISGFKADPGFTGGGASGVAYANGVLTFTPVDGGHYAYFFTNRTASAGQTLKINADPTAGNYFAVAGIGYANMHTLLGPDIPSNVSSTYTTADGLLALHGYSDTPGTIAANIFENVDWFGIAGGGANNEAIDGTESLSLQFSSGTGLTGLGTRYTSGQVVISGFGSDPGFTDPSGTATGVSYAAGTLSYTFNQYRSPEIIVNFTNLSASAGQTLSLHTDGNAGSQIALTRINYAVPLAPVTLLMAKEGTNVVLTWPQGTLQQSTSINGTFSDLTGVTSPYTNAISGPQLFFRVKVQ